MPILDGIRATQQLREENYSLPILALTAHAMAGERERCISKGFTDYLAKPINVSQLITMASRYKRPWTK
jgi:CheY-like chemotaxis protein